MKTMQTIEHLDESLSMLEHYTNKLNAKDKVIKSTERILATLVDQCPLPMWVKDLNSSMLFFNEAYSRIYGKVQAQTLGKKDSEVWPDEIAKEFIENDQKVLVSDKVYTVEVIPTNNKNRVDTDRDHITVVKWIVRNQGVPIGIAGMVTSVFP